MYTYIIGIERKERLYVCYLKLRAGEIETEKCLSNFRRLKEFFLERRILCDGELPTYQLSYFKYFGNVTFSHAFIYACMFARVCGPVSVFIYCSLTPSTKQIFVLNLCPILFINLL